MSLTKSVLCYNPQVVHFFTKNPQGMGSLNFDNIPHLVPDLDKVVLSYSHDVDFLHIPKFENVIDLKTFPLRFQDQ